MKIKKFQITNFTVFEKQDIEFCEGVNVIIGANGTGKSHLLKILYAMTQWMTGERHDNPKEKNLDRFNNLLNGLFKPYESDLTLLMRDRANNAVSNIEILSTDGKGSDAIIFANKENQCYFDPSIITLLPNAKGKFIPPNEVLAMYYGFTASYEKRELSFDQSYYDLCKALAATPLKKKNGILSQLVSDLEDILQGTVIQKGDHFFIKNKESERTLEAHLLAEGHRKIATLVHLIKNGSIDENTILFWDEPEANMNPLLIKPIADGLRTLAKIGVQVFITTHDYLLTSELSLAAEYKTQPQIPIRFFAMSRKGDEPVSIQSGDTLADLQENPILDEFASHYDRERLLFYTQAEVN